MAQRLRWGGDEMTIKIVFEFDGEIMLNDVPIEYSPTRIVEDAIRQLRADIAERDARIAELTLAHSELISNYLSACQRKDNAEAELARLRAQEPVAWQFCGERDDDWSECTKSLFDAINSRKLPAMETRALYAEPIPAPSLKDHEIVQLVNALRDCAVEFYAAQQLRERIAAIVVPVLRGVRSPMPANVAEQVPAKAAE